MLRPLNKHLVVQPIEEVKTDSGVLLPEGTKISKEPYKLVEVLEVQEDSNLERGCQIVVPSHVVEEVSFFGKTHYLVLENHVVGFYEKAE